MDAKDEICRIQAYYETAAPEHLFGDTESEKNIKALTLPPTASTPPSTKYIKKNRKFRSIYC